MLINLQMQTLNSLKLASKTFIKIRAYETLSDENKRQMYDSGIDPEEQDGFGNPDDFQDFQGFADFGNFGNFQGFHKVNEKDFEKFASKFGGLGFDPFEIIFEEIHESSKGQKSKRKDKEVQKKQNITIGK